MVEGVNVGRPARTWVGAAGSGNTWATDMKKRIFLTECGMGVGSGRGASNVHPCTMEAKRGIRAAFSLCCGGIP